MKSPRLWLISACTAAFVALTSTGTGAMGLEPVGVTTHQTDQLISGPATWLAAALLLCLLGRGVVAHFSRKRISGSHSLVHRRFRS